MTDERLATMSAAVQLTQQAKREAESRGSGDPETAGTMVVDCDDLAWLLDALAAARAELAGERAALAECRKTVGAVSARLNALTNPDEAWDTGRRDTLDEVAGWLHMDADHVTAEDVQAQCESLAAASAEVEEARRDERAAVVAWLNEHGGYPGARGLMAAALAEGVEQCEHLGAEPHRQEEDGGLDEPAGGGVPALSPAPDDGTASQATAHLSEDRFDALVELAYACQRCRPKLAEMLGMTEAALTKAATSTEARDAFLMRVSSISAEEVAAIGAKQASAETAHLSEVAANALRYREARRQLTQLHEDLMAYSALAAQLPDNSKASAYKAAAGHVVALEVVLDDPATLARLQTEARVIEQAAEVASTTVEAIRAELAAPRAPSRHEGAVERADAFLALASKAAAYDELRAGVVAMRDELAATWGTHGGAALHLLVSELDDLLACCPEVK